MTETETVEPNAPPAPIMNQAAYGAAYAGRRGSDGRLRAVDLAAMIERMDRYEALIKLARLGDLVAEARNTAVELSHQADWLPERFLSMWEGFGQRLVEREPALAADLRIELDIIGRETHLSMIEAHRQAAVEKTAVRLLVWKDELIADLLALGAAGAGGCADASAKLARLQEIHGALLSEPRFGYLPDVAMAETAAVLAALKQGNLVKGH